MSTRVVLFLTLLTLGGLGSAASAATNVASFGTDSAGCGAAATPCATVAQAITNSAPGGTIVVAPGTYAGFTVGKRVTVTSTGGAAVTIITSAVTIAAEGTIFGRNGKGFTLDGASTCVGSSADEIRIEDNVARNCGTGFAVSGTGVHLLGNQALNSTTRGFHIFGSATVVQENHASGGPTGFELDPASSGAVVRQNVAVSTTTVGFFLRGADHLLEENAALNSGGVGVVVGSPSSGGTLRENAAMGSSGTHGFLLIGVSGWTLKGNVSSNNEHDGFRLDACTSCHVEGNTAAGNGLAGFHVEDSADPTLIRNAAFRNGGGFLIQGTSSGVEIHQSNMAGNTSNCGLANITATVVDATNNFWGKSTGPGTGEPSDEVCGAGPVTTVPFATKAFTVSAKTPF